MTNLQLVEGLSRGVFVAWVDVVLHGAQHACCIAMHPTHAGVLRRVDDWRRLDRWTCAGRHGASVTVDVQASVDPESPASRSTWSKELAYRDAMHGVWCAVPGDLRLHNTLMGLSVAWGETLGLRSVCMLRLWFKADLQCGVDS